MAKKQRRRTAGAKSKYLCPSHSGPVRQAYTMHMTASTRRMYMECMAIMNGMEKHLGKKINRLSLAQDRMMAEAFGKFRRDKIKQLRRLGIDHKPMIEDYWQSYYAPRAKRMPMKIKAEVKLSGMVDDFGPSV